MTFLHQPKASTWKSHYLCVRVRHELNYCRAGIASVSHLCLNNHRTSRGAHKETSPSLIVSSYTSHKQDIFFSSSWRGTWKMQRNLRIASSSSWCTRHLSCYSVANSHWYHFQPFWIFVVCLVAFVYTVYDESSAIRFWDFHIQEILRMAVFATAISLCESEKLLCQFQRRSFLISWSLCGCDALSNSSSV